jgi:6-phosphogluconolactonase
VSDFSFDVRRFASPVEVAEAVEASLTCKLEEAAAGGRTFWLSLAGGTTPKALYQQWATQALPWSHLGLVWGDERFVGHQHPDSNFRMVREAMLDRLRGSLNPASILAWPDPSGEDLEEANWAESSNRCAAEYGRRLRELFAHHPLDLALLGMGDDGHTASLFPGTAALDEQHHWAVANWVEKFKSYRLSLTYPFFAQAREIIFVVTGAGKQQALREVVRDGLHPSAKIRCAGKVWIYCDEAAAALL